MSVNYIALAVPFFFLLIGVELLIAWRTKRRLYRLNDAVTDMSCGIGQQVTGAFLMGVLVAGYGFVYERWAIVTFEAGSIVPWIVAFLGVDLAYYWWHRFSHEVAFMWAVHVVHHQSEDYNLSTALRQTSSGALLGWVFYLPMAIIGVPPLVFGTVALIDLLYQFWVHTQQVGKLGWFDRWFCSPSNHRVHHAVNDRYLDRNYGGILIVWDRLFGTFHEEDDDEPCIYGTRAPLRSFNPLWANVEVYAALARDAARARSWWDKLRIWFEPPGWRPADVAERFPKPQFRIEQVQRYDPPTSRGAQWLALVLFTVMLAVVCWLLWHAHEGSTLELLGGTALILAGLWTVGRLGEGRRVPAAVAPA
jgi:alkylglycerol monooxygenase